MEQVQRENVYMETKCSEQWGKGKWLPGLILWETRLRVKLWLPSKTWGGDGKVCLAQWERDDEMDPSCKHRIPKGVVQSKLVGEGGS